MAFAPFSGEDTIGRGKTAGVNRLPTAGRPVDKDTVIWQYLDVKILI
jgi:hypothetical protein